MFIEQVSRRTAAAVLGLCALAQCSLARTALAAQPGGEPAPPRAAAPSTSPSAAGSADAGTLAAAHFERGFQLARSGKLEGAILAFEAAYTTQPNFAVLYNLALTYAAVGRDADALGALQRYLDLGAEQVPAERRERVQALIHEHLQGLGSLARELHPELQAAEGRLELQCPVPDARVWLDGSALPGPLPSSRVTSAGEHEIRFGRGGYRVSVLRVQVARGVTTPVSCQLSTDPTDASLARLIVRHPAGTRVTVDGGPHDAPLPPGPHRVLVSGPGYQPLERPVTLLPRETQTLQLVPPRSADVLAREHDQGRHTIRSAGYVTLATAIATGAAAVSLYLYDDSADRHWQRQSDALVERLHSDPNSVQPAQLDALLEEENRIRDRDSIALGLSVLGGACLAASAVLFWWSREDGPSLTTTGSAVSLRLHF